MISPTSRHLANLAYLSLGSNVGPEHYLPAAVEKLRTVGDILRVSRVWQSPPVGYVHQADFCNAAVLLEVDLAAVDLKREVIARIESDLDRVRDPRNPSGPRTIDIDIALFNEDRISVGAIASPIRRFSFARSWPSRWRNSIRRTGIRRPVRRFMPWRRGSVRSRRWSNGAISGWHKKKPATAGKQAAGADSQCVYSECAGQAGCLPAGQITSGTRPLRRGTPDRASASCRRPRRAVRKRFRVPAGRPSCRSPP